MPRLFVAVDLPADVKTQLIALQPSQKHWMKLEKPEQLHLTLHFLGEWNVKHVIEALQHVRVETFPMAVQGVGCFAGHGRQVIFWAGVQPTVELLQLHSDVAVALMRIGYQPETRPFSPHVTLARGRPGTPRPVIVEFLRRHADWKTSEFSVAGFRLMSSNSSADGPIYRCEQVFPN